MRTTVMSSALALSLLLPAATAQGVQIQDVKSGKTPVSQNSIHAAKVLAEVQAVFREEMAKIERPTRGATKEERAAYSAAFQKARTAQENAAKKALAQHANVLAHEDAAKHRAQLQTIAGEHVAAMKSYLAHAKASDSAAERNDALVLAANLCSRYGDGALAAQKLLEQVDVTKLTARTQRMHKSLESRLASDIKREKLNGQPAPSFASLHVLGGAKGESGDAFDLSKYAGKVVLVDFWATWCGPCRAVIPSLVDMQKEYGDKIQVLGVTRLYGYGSDFSDPSSDLPHGGKTVRNLDEAAELEINRAFAERFALNYPIVISDRAASQAYAVRGIPTIYVIDQHGKIVSSVVGSGEANHEKIVKTVNRLLGTKGDHGHAEDASGEKHKKHD